MLPALVLFGLVGLMAWRAANRRTRLLHLRELRQVQRRAQAADGAAAHLDALLEAIGAAETDALLRLDADRRIAWANPAATQRFSLDPNRPASLLSVTGSATLEELLDEMVPGQPLEEMVSIGSQRFRVSLARATSGDLVLAMRDETDNERLTRSRRDMVANISHDLRTPLTAIGLLVERLELPDLTPHERVALVATIRDQLAALRRLAEGLVELSRLESGRLPMRLSPVPVLELARATAESLQPMLEKYRIELVFDVDPDLSALVDASQVGRALGNLVDNAIHASRQGSTIRITAQPTEPPDMLELQVIDEGSGIPPHDLERIFERFYRADRSRSLRGTGLGLAIVKHVVERHGGRVEARNNPVQGATISLTLPAAE